MSESLVWKEDSSKQCNLQQGNLLLTRARASRPHQGCEDEKTPKPQFSQLFIGYNRVIGTSGLVTQLQGNFCWPNPCGLPAFP